jgi:hypothetical protein
MDITEKLKKLDLLKETCYYKKRKENPLLFHQKPQSCHSGVFTWASYREFSSNHLQIKYVMISAMIENKKESKKSIVISPPLCCESGSGNTRILV